MFQLISYCAFDLEVRVNTNQNNNNLKLTLTICKTTPRSNTSCKVKIFDVQEMQQRKSNAHSKSYVYQSMSRYLTYIGNTNGELDLISAKCTVIDELMRLVLKFPNFKSVIEFYVKQIALQQFNPLAVIAAEPVLVIGGAGIGKTAFTLALARILKIRHWAPSIQGYFILCFINNKYTLKTQHIVVVEYWEPSTKNTV